MNVREEKLDLVVDGVNLPSILTRPSCGKPLANILLIPGMNDSDIDGNYPLMHMHPHIYKDLSQQLAERGYLVLRYAKYGPCTGSITGAKILDEKLAARHNHFSERVTVAKGALDLLVKNKAEDVPTIVAGHSEGNMIAFILAQDSQLQIDGVISLSGPAYRFFDLMIYPPEKDNKAEDVDKVYFDALKEMVALVRQGKSIPPRSFSNPKLSFLSHLDNKAWQYLCEVDSIDPSEETVKVKQPVLLVQGKLDASILPANASTLREKRGTLSTELSFFGNLQHFYKKTTLEDSKTFNNLECESDQAVTVEIDRWINKTILKLSNPTTTRVQIT